MKLRTLSFYGCLLAVLAVVAGCSESEPMGTVEGKVTIEGEPMTEGMITFFTADQSNGGSAELGPSGEFKMEKPIPAASYNVMVTPPPLMEADDPEKVDMSRFKKIPMKYQSEVTTDLKVQVQEGPNQFTFDLKR